MIGTYQRAYTKGGPIKAFLKQKNIILFTNLSKNYQKSFCLYLLNFLPTLRRFTNTKGVAHIRDFMVHSSDPPFLKGGGSFPKFTEREGGHKFM